MASHIALDWFPLNSTQLSNKYGPSPLWDVLANYTANKPGKDLASKDESPVTYGFATGALFVLALSSRSQFQFNVLKNGFTLLSKQFIYQFSTLAAVFIVVPIVLIFLAALAVYKQLVGMYLNRSLLCGADAVWALDASDEKSKAIVNVLAILNGDISLNELQELIKIKFIPASNKLSFHRKYSSLGYFYWTQQHVVDITSQVRVLAGCEEGEEVNEDELRNKISAVSNEPLPESHAAGWEVLLGPRLRSTPDDDAPRTALLFRVHHSVGDGPALCRLFISAVADSDTSYQHPDISNLLAKKIRNCESLLTMLRDGVTGLTEQASMKPDCSPLHGAVLSGHKQLAWRGSRELLLAAQSVRQLTGAPFTAGLLAALNAAVAEHLGLRNMKTKGASFTVVIPARLPSQISSHAQELDNAFSMALVRTPLTESSTTPLARVRVAEAALKTATRPAVLVANSWAVQLAGGLLPRPLATPALYGGQCTSVLSNMPGPTQTIAVAGRTISQLVFWVPHRTNTGLGASALSYAGELNLSVIVDEALITTPEDAQRLVCAWEQHLLQLAASLGAK